MTQSRNNTIGGLHFVEVDRGAWTECHVSGNAKGDSSAAFDELFRTARASDAGFARVFGVGAEVAEKMRKGCGGAVSVEYFEQPAQAGSSVGVYAIFVSVKGEGGAKKVDFGDGAAGWVVEKPGFRMGYAPGVVAGTASVESFQETFDEMFARLDRMDFAAVDLTRTWCYLSELLRDYGDFNNARKESFRKQGLLNGVLPASTGVQGRPADGSPLTISALAFSGEGARREAVTNPAQCEATQYGPLFSRAIRVRGAGAEQLIVSGMASIGETGDTLFVGNPIVQADNTIERAQAFLESAGFGWPDVTGGLIYIRKDCYQEVAKHLSQTALNQLPFCRVEGDICRENLLFEMEFMAFG